ncbi:ABC transporter permease [Thalassotalea psychrophila]|uniref:Transport permease protein n=1 Tax=Thalassotalea psychrophila TaxID=3065647 RepID=A0ABY9TR74_9GAMM|nr:ABC transporter permease [Colwelliaceae bacterium SQ149]
MAEVIKRSRIQVWQDVIFAIFLREIRSQFNDKFGISWAIVNPLIFIFVLSYGRSMLMGDTTHAMPTFMFMLFGMLFVQLFLGTLGAASTAIKKNKPLFAFRQVQPISAVIALVLFELLVNIVIIIVLFALIYFMKFEAQLNNPLLIGGYLLQLWLISVSLGLIFAIAASFISEIQKIQSLLQRPMFFLSGIFFSLQDIPKEYWGYLDWNPVLHAVELSRDAAYPTFGAQGVSDTYLLSCTIVLVFFALACYRITWKQVLSR